MQPMTFDPTAAGFTREAALYMANVCDLAYVEDPVAAAKELLGLDVQVFHHEASDTQGFVGRGRDFAVLAFRGSEKLDEHPKDWLTNFHFRQEQAPNFTGRVHSGFATTLSSAWDVVDALFRRAKSAAEDVGADDPDLPLFVTGHSLGGALATLASCRLAALAPPAAGAARPIPVNFRAAYTFGAPRVGDPDFCRAYTPFTCRIVNDLDIVPQVPLQGREVQRYLDRLPSFTPEWIKKLVRDAAVAPPYGHVETLHHLDENGAVSKQAAGANWLEDYIQRCLRSPLRSLNAPVRDHMIDSYIQALAR